MIRIRDLTDGCLELALGRLTLLGILAYPIGNLGLELAGLTTGPRLNDFGAYYNAGIRLLHAYPLFINSINYPELASLPYSNMDYLYHPIISLLFIPFVLLPFTIAGIAWNATCLLILWWAVVSLLRALEVELSRVREVLVLWLLVGFAPTITWLKLGQISGLLAALVCFSGASLIRQQGTPLDQQSTFSGAFIVISGLIKPYYLPAGAYLLLKRRRVTSTFLTGLGLSIAGIAIFGISSNVEYLHVLMEGKGWNSTGPWNATNFRPFGVFGSMALPIKILITISMIGLGLLVRDRLPAVHIRSTFDSRQAEQMLFALGVAIIPLVSPSSNVLALSVLIPVFVIVLASEVRRPDGRLAIPLLALLLIEVHPYTIEFIAKFGPQYIPELSALQPYLPWLQPGVWGLFLLVGFIGFRLSGDLHTVVSTRIEDNPSELSASD